ncbi:MAG: HD domain-containing protein [Oscillospiraceae bacterium]|nr:HD domain-containing protein [Oscillospiraceae bacterium]
MDQKLARVIERQLVTLGENGRMELTKQYCQHGTCSVYVHCLHVAYVSCLLCRRLGIRVRWRELIRGALLHDYFLYDWHDKASRHRLHGFYHPGVALRNAREDFRLTRTEEDIILHHMFPLTVIPPHTREGWIVSCADKICTVLEVLRKECVVHEAYDT